MDQWRGKIAVVTGASSGIGRAIALALASEDITVIGLARNMVALQSLVQRSEADERKAKESGGNFNYGKIHPLECDVTNVESIKITFTEIAQRFGAVHILVNNAGCYKVGKFFDETLTYEDMLATINTNFTGAIICTREAFRLMKSSNEHSYIIYINTPLGHESPMYAMADTNVYSATKHALRQQADAIRLDIGNDEQLQKIRVSSIVSGTCRTNIMQGAGLSGTEVSKAYEQLKYVKPEDVAATVKFVLSSDVNINIAEVKIKRVGEKL